MNMETPLTIEKEPLHVKVTRAILKHIRANNLKPGDKLPSERQMVVMFDVGRNTVREAISMLQEEGIVEVVTHSGTFVRKEVFDDGQMVVALMKVNYCDLLDIKMWLEQLAIRRANEYATPQQLDLLIEYAHNLEKRGKNNTYPLEADHLFHRQLLACAGSSTLSQLVLSLNEQINRYTSMLASDGSWINTTPYHMDIARGLKEGNLSIALAAHAYIRELDIEVLNKLDKGE